MNQATDSLSRASQRLASGQRINQASDDAAGLAIASQLNSSSRVYAQAMRNIGDGISYLNVAEGAAGELKFVLTRIQELSVQASNGTYSDKQRSSLDTESLKLQEEYNRIIDSTTFNGLDVLKVPENGSSTVVFQAGYGTDETLSVTLGYRSSVTTTTVDGTFSTPLTFGSGSTSMSGGVLTDTTGDGKLDIVSNYNNRLVIFAGNGDGTFKSSTTVTVNSNGGYAFEDINGDGIMDFSGIHFNTRHVVLGNGNGTFKITQVFEDPGNGVVQFGDVNGDSLTDMVSGEYSSGRIFVHIGNGGGTFKAATSYDATGVRLEDIEIVDFNGDGRDDIGASHRWVAPNVHVLMANSDGSFNAPSQMMPGAMFYMESGDLNNDGKVDLISSGNSQVNIHFGNGNGTFNLRVSFATSGLAQRIVAEDLDEDGNVDLVVADHASRTLEIFMGNGNGTFLARRTLDAQPGGSVPNEIRPAIGDIDGDGVLDLAAFSASSSTPGISVYLQNATTETTTSANGLSRISNISLSTRDAALSAQDRVQTYVLEVDQLVGTLGAAVSRMETAVEVLRSRRLGFQAAESRIIDADIANESSIVVRSRILQDVAAAVLSQSNQQPAIALQLLG